MTYANTLLNITQPCLKIHELVGSNAFLNMPAFFYFILFFSSPKRKRFWLTCASKNIFEHGRNKRCRVRVRVFWINSISRESSLKRQVCTDNVNLFALSSVQDFTTKRAKCLRAA